MYVPVSIPGPIALAFLLLTGACASTPEDRASRETTNKPLRGGVAEFKVTSYDGKALEGRVLLGATIDTLVVDGLMLESSAVELDKVHVCGKTEFVPYYIVDWVLTSEPPSVTLPRGYWYGKDVHFSFDMRSMGPGPDCFEAELVVWALHRRVAARLPIKVVRTDKPPPALNGGTEAPEPPPSDAGAP